MRLDGDVITAHGGPARNPFYFDERAAEKSPLFLAGNEQDRQLSEKFGLLTSHRSVDSFEMLPQNSSSRDPLAVSTTRKQQQRRVSSNSSGTQTNPNGRFHFLRQWFVGGGVEMQTTGSVSPYEDEEEEDVGEEEELECGLVDQVQGKDIELRRMVVSSSTDVQPALLLSSSAHVDEFVDDGVDMCMDFEDEINDLVAAYPHYSEALEAAAELQSLRRREMEFGSDSSSLRGKDKGKKKKKKGKGEGERHQSAAANGVQRRGGCQCCACFRAPSTEYEGEEDSDMDGVGRGGGDDGESMPDECCSIGGRHHQQQRR